MPSLVAFNRRWGIGSDDFVFPGLLEVFLRFVWLIAVSIVYSIHEDNFGNCDGGHQLRLYYIGLLTLISVCIIITSIIVFISCKGSIINTFPRRSLAKILYVRFAIGIPEVAWNIVGTYWSFGWSSGCTVDVVDTAKGAVICGWLLAFIVIVLFLITFDPLGGRKKPLSQRNKLLLQSKDSEQIMSNARIAARKAWERRCKFLCCCVLCDDQSKDAFSDIAKLLSDFFEGIDIVPTDIAAGLILVQQNQEHEQNKLQTVTVSSSNTAKPAAATVSSSNTAKPMAATVDLTNQPSTDHCIPTPKEWMTTEIMTHYMKFAMGSYGWPLYMFTHLTTGLCRLAGQCKCFACVMQSDQIKEDNCCQCHMAAIRRTTEISDEDIVYCSFHNQIYKIPFYVVIDREKQAVVVAIRGTLSLTDALTDMTAGCEALEMDCFDDCVAHKGILQAAMYIKQKLEELQLLTTAFQRAQGARLVVTGHSLGAGAAALLAVMLKPDYPDIMCFAFSPPGGLMGYSLSCRSQEFICSVILGKDLVPRLGVRTLEDLKSKILREMRNCDTPKYRILMSGVWQLFTGVCCNDDNKNSERQLLDRPIVPSYVNGNLKTEIENFIMCSEQCRITQQPMYPPGQIMHIMEVDKDGGCFSTPNYYAEWKSNTEFEEILVSPDMLSDHLPDNVMEALTQLSRKNFTPRVHTRHVDTIESTTL